MGCGLFLLFCRFMFMSDYFTADPHFGHDNIRKYCKRPFASCAEMDQAIIDNINRKVKSNDRLFVLGDFCWGVSQRRYLDRINCRRVILISGNHDKGELQDFSEVYDYYEYNAKIDGKSRLIVLFHYPIKEWNQWHRGSWHLFGHTHQQIPDDPYNYSLDIGVDGHNFEPLGVDEIAAIMAKKQWEDPFKNWEKTGKLWKDNRKTEEELAAEKSQRP